MDPYLAARQLALMEASKTTCPAKHQGKGPAPMLVPKQEGLLVTPGARLLAVSLSLQPKNCSCSDPPAELPARTGWSPR